MTSLFSWEEERKQKFLTRFTLCLAFPASSITTVLTRGSGHYGQGSCSSKISIHVLTGVSILFARHRMPLALPYLATYDLFIWRLTSHLFRSRHTWWPCTGQVLLPLLPEHSFPSFPKGIFCTSQINYLYLNPCFKDYFLWNSNQDIQQISDYVSECRLAKSALLGNLLEKQILKLSSRPLIQKLWDWDEQFVF